MRTGNEVFRRFIPTLLAVSLVGCTSDRPVNLRARLDESTGRTVYEYVMPCYVSRSYTPWGEPIKKVGPQPNLIQIVNGGVGLMPDADACMEVTDEGKVIRVPGSCPPIMDVSPEMCEDK